MTASRPGVTIIPIHGHTPRIHDSAFIAPGCTIIGNVEIGADSSVWYNCVLRADVSRIVIGERSNIQDGSVVHCDPERPGDPDGSPCIIGDDVLVGGDGADSIYGGSGADTLQGDSGDGRRSPPHHPLLI